MIQRQIKLPDEIVSRQPVPVKDHELDLVARDEALEGLLKSKRVEAGGSG
jgi:hypothetical protein